MKHETAVLALVLVLMCSVAGARDFGDYVIGKMAYAYPELVFNQAHGGILVFTAPQQKTVFCGIECSELKVSADSSGIIVSKLLTVRDKQELDALDVLLVWCSGLQKSCGAPKSMVVDGSPVEDKKSFDKELASFFKNGEALDLIYQGKSSANIASLKRIVIDEVVSYDVSVFMANN